MTGRVPTVSAAAAALLLAVTTLVAQPPAATAPPASSSQPDNIKDLGTKQEFNQKQFLEFKSALLRLAQKLQRSDKPEDQDRAKVILAALDEANKRGVESLFAKLVQSMRAGGNAQDIAGMIGQDAQLTKALQDILNILLTDDETARMKAEIARLEAFLKEAKDIKRQQETLRAMTEAKKSDKDRLGKSQDGLANRTKDLADRMNAGKKGEQQEKKPSDGAAGEPKDDKAEPKADAKPGEDAATPKDDTDGAKSESKDGDPKDGEPKSGDPKGGEPKSGEPKAGEPKGGEPKAGEPKAGDPKNGEPKAGEPKSGEPKTGEPKSGEPKAGEPKPSDAGAESKAPPKNQKDAAGEPKPGQPKAGEAKPSEGKPGDPKEAKPQAGEGKSAGEGKAQSKPSQGKGGESKSKGEPKDQQSQAKGGGQQQQNQQQQQQQQQNAQSQQPPPGEQLPGRKQVQEAYPHMKDVLPELQKDNRPNAGKKQDEAITKLEEAIKDLEKRLKQLREEETLKLLANLEQRCNRMLAMQIEVYESTKAIDATVQKNGGQKSNAEIQKSQQQGDKEQEIVAEADKALKLLESEGSAVAFARVLEEVRQDMAAIQKRLASAYVDKDTQFIEENVIAMLKEMVIALKKAQQEMQQQQQQPPQQQQQAQKPNQRLIDLIAELKLIRSMQLQVNSRTKMYGDKDKSAQQTADPLVQAELKQLSARQAKLQDMIQKIATGENQ